MKRTGKDQRNSSQGSGRSRAKTSRNAKSSGGPKSAGGQSRTASRPAKKRSPQAGAGTGSRPAQKERTGGPRRPAKRKSPATNHHRTGEPRKNPTPRVNGPIRLQKFLASCGLGSRRACEDLITEGRVTIDGEIATLGATIDPKSQRVHFDGQHLRPEPRRYYLLNKPRGVLCTNYDSAGRPRVIDLFPEDSPRLFPVGRLDEDSEGLLIVTNDGDFSHLLAHPRHRIYRTYKVQVAGDPDRETLEQLKKGFFFSEGKFKVHDVKPVKRQGQSTFLEVTLTEGQNREIRRLMARIGHKVMTLQRVAFGPIQLGRVKVGKFRMLRNDEIEKLESIVARNMQTN